MLIDEIREYLDDPNYHPAYILAMMSKDPELDEKLRLRASESLMPYIEPKLKHVEVSGNLDSSVGLLRVVHEAGTAS